MTPICRLCSSASASVRYRKHEFAICQCHDCGLVFTHLPEGFDLLKIYDESYFQGGQTDGYGDYRGTEAVLRREFRNTLRELRALQAVRSGSLLEIGSAYGFFLDEARQYFDCTGIEVSLSAVEFARARGHRIIQGTLTEDVADQVGPVDAVVLFDVIEHLPDPVETFRLIDRCLKRGGHIVVTTGDIGSWSARLFGSHWRLMTPPQHTSFFSKRTLTTLFHQFGYSVERVTRPWKVIPLSLAAYQLGSRLGYRVPALERLNVMVPVNLFDTVLMVGCKR